MTAARPHKLAVVAGVFLAMAMLMAAGRDAPTVGALTNGKIAFGGETENGTEIFSMNPDGSQRLQLTNNGVNDEEPVWSPDGTKIAFHREVSQGRYHIFVMNADGSNPQDISQQTPEADDNSPSWSPDGTKIVFTSFQSGGGPEIWVMNADGSDQVQLTNVDQGFERNPTWSPDGTKIAFRSERDGNAEVYVMNADGTGQTRLTFDGAFTYPSDWSPDSSRILLASGGDIMTIAPDGGNLESLGLVGSDPKYSPDGSLIIYEDSGLWTANADGSNPQQLLGSVNDDADPDWQALSLRAGDTDCSGDVRPLDAIPALASLAGIEVHTQCLLAANVRCTDALNTADVEAILRFTAELPADIPGGCTPIGQEIS